MLRHRDCWCQLLVVNNSRLLLLLPTTCSRLKRWTAILSVDFICTLLPVPTCSERAALHLLYIQCTQTSETYFSVMKWCAVAFKLQQSNTSCCPDSTTATLHLLGIYYSAVFNNIYLCVSGVLQLIALLLLYAVLRLNALLMLLLQSRYIGYSLHQPGRLPELCNASLSWKVHLTRNVTCF